jgi:UDP-N-acetylmuramoyl-tripeptide--D-alanyl-D-alanine ligase
MPLPEEPIWLAEEAAASTGGVLVGSDSWLASGVSIDTRTLQPGDLFVALKDVRDGHDFLDAAFAAGASAALVSDRRAAAGPVLQVDDTLIALQRLAETARNRSPAKRIGVTGSVGKTSTKDTIAACLSAIAPTHASIKSYNNHWGVPLTLARMMKSSAFGVFEMGMNHRGEIEPLAKLVAPDVAIITWIAPAHIENLGSLEAIADEKADIYAGLKPDGAALVPADAPFADRLLAHAHARSHRVLRFGAAPGCDARLINFTPDPDGGSIIAAEILGAPIRFKIGAQGAHWANNSLAALLAVAALDADIAKAAAALESFAAPAGRGQVLKLTCNGAAFTLIDDSYNANPTSMAAALSSLAARQPGPNGRRIAALGDMLELGENEARYHAELAGPIAAAGVDLVYCAGPRMAALWQALPQERRGAHTETASELTIRLKQDLRTGDVVLAKGSNGSKLHELVAALKSGDA